MNNKKLVDSIALTLTVIAVSTSAVNLSSKTKYWYIYIIALSVVSVLIPMNLLKRKISNACERCPPIAILSMGMLGLLGLYILDRIAWHLVLRTGH
jgi:hypothetical protein